MTPEWIAIIWQNVIGLGLAMARILPILILVPIFTGLQLKGIVRHGCAMALALLLLPYINPLIGQQGISIAFLIFKETALGFFMALLLSMPFWIFDWVGILIDSQRGALNGTVFNPALGSESLIGGALKQSVTLLLILTGGLPVMFDVVWQSYLIWPPTQWLPLPQQDGIDLWLSQVSHLFSSMILYAAPIVICLLFVDFGMAVLGLFSPHLQVSILAMPIKSLLGLALLVVYLPKLWEWSHQEFEQFHYLPEMLRLMFSAG